MSRGRARHRRSSDRSHQHGRCVGTRRCTAHRGCPRSFPLMDRPTATDRRRIRDGAGVAGSLPWQARECHGSECPLQRRGVGDTAGRVRSASSPAMAPAARGQTVHPCRAGRAWTARDEIGGATPHCCSHGPGPPGAAPCTRKRGHWSPGVAVRAAGGTGGFPSRDERHAATPGADGRPRRNREPGTRWPWAGAGVGTWDGDLVTLDAGRVRCRAGCYEPSADPTGP